MVSPTPYPHGDSRTCWKDSLEAWESSNEEQLTSLQLGHLWPFGIGFSNFSPSLSQASLILVSIWWAWYALTFKWAVLIYMVSYNNILIFTFMSVWAIMLVPQLCLCFRQFYILLVPAVPITDSALWWESGGCVDVLGAEERPSPLECPIVFIFPSLHFKYFVFNCLLLFICFLKSIPRLLCVVEWHIFLCFR